MFHKQKGHHNCSYRELMKEIYVPSHQLYLTLNGCLPTLTSETLGKAVLTFLLLIHVAVSCNRMRQPQRLSFLGYLTEHSFKKYHSAFLVAIHKCCMLTMLSGFLWWTSLVYFRKNPRKWPKHAYSKSKGKNYISPSLKLKNWFWSSGAETTHVLAHIPSAAVLQDTHRQLRLPDLCWDTWTSESAQLC